VRLTIFIVFILLAAKVHAGSTQVVTLDVQNMSCGVCPITVRKALEKVPGVTEMRVDFDGKTATVHFDPDKTTINELTKAPTDAGYPATVRK